MNTAINERKEAVMKKIPIGYQLYSAREAAEKDLKGICRALKSLGYDGVEFAGFYGHSAEEIKKILDDTGLVGISSHVGIQSIEQDMFGAIAFHQAIGCKFIAVPSLDNYRKPGNPGFPASIRLLDKFGRLCKEAGIQLLYHNHDFEFVDVSGIYGLDFLFEAVDPDILKTQIDVCWVKYAGVEPTAYLRKYAGRAPLIHMKDFVGKKGEGTPYALIGQTAEADQGVPFAYKPFGYGCQDVKALVEAGMDAGAEWFIIEQDDCYEQDPMDAAGLSMKTMIALGVK